MVVLLRKLKNTTHFRLPQHDFLSPSKIAKCRLRTEHFQSESLSYAKPEETPATLSRSVGSKIPAVCKVDKAPTNSIFPVSGLGLSKVNIGSSKIEQHSALLEEDVTLTKYQMNLSESE